MQQRTMLRLLEDLADGPATVDDLCTWMPTSRRNVLRYLADARRARRIHIIGWERVRGCHRAIYAIGAGRDAPALPRMPAAERQARYRGRRA